MRVEFARSVHEPPLGGRTKVHKKAPGRFAGRHRATRSEAAREVPIGPPRRAMTSSSWLSQSPHQALRPSHCFCII